MVPSYSSSTKRILYSIAILAVAILAIVTRVRAVNYLPVDYDEDEWFRAAQLIAREIRTGNWTGLMETNYRPEHPSLVKIVYGVTFSFLPEVPLVPDREVAPPRAEYLPQPHLHIGRLVSMIFGALEVIALTILNPLAGIFLAIHSVTVKYHSELMLESLPALTSALTIITYVLARKKYTLPQTNYWLFISAFFLGMTAAGKYLYCVVGVAIVVDWLLLAWKERSFNAIGKIFLWGLFSIIIFILFDPYLWPAPLGRLGESVLYHQQYSSSSTQVVQAAFPTWQPFVWLLNSVSESHQAFLITPDFTIFILALAGMKRLWEYDRIYVFWIGISFIFLLVWPTKWAQYVLILTFPWCLSAAFGVRALLWDPTVTWLSRRHRGGEPNG